MSLKISKFRSLLFATVCCMLVLLLGCVDGGSSQESPQPTQPDEDNQLIQTGMVEGVIFSQANAENSFIPGNNAYEGYWMPSEADILALESGLPAYLQAQAEVIPDRLWRQPPVWERLPEYKCQYVGIIEDGKRAIYANYFCSGGESWEEQFVSVEDGGDCYFQLKYEVETGQFYDLQVNGEA